MSSVGIGLMYVVTALVPVPLFYLKIPPLTKLTATVFLLKLPLWDLLFIIGEGVVGISVVNQHKLFGLTEYVAIPILASAWLGSLAFNLLLAINRLHTICGFHLSRSLKHFLSACSYVYWLFFLVAYASRLSPMPFVDEYTFAYDTDVPFARLVQAMEFYSSCVILGLTFIIYVKVITFILLQKLRSR
ncbi:hypothetical protein L596_020869 [Steinernema carpocapsae]|uniref:7TM GPCR serpentine receptor class x (Srx) domain-containing protein n=1 Tax=Steinernema carpocapsae TaxID=34508 RepID=A0A4U5MUU7_STECR|nr:hypothetical protein L596_020869 [Steinernema carpocapsae]